MRTALVQVAKVNRYTRVITMTTKLHHHDNHYIAKSALVSDCDSQAEDSTYYRVCWKYGLQSNGMARAHLQAVKKKRKRKKSDTSPTFNTCPD